MRAWILAAAMVACSGKDDADDGVVGDDDDDVVGDDDDVVGDDDDDDDVTTSTSETGNPVVLPPYDDVFLWQPITFDDAVDLGFAVGAVATGDQVDSGGVVMTEVGVAAGLGGSVGGGDSHGVGVGFFDFDGDGWEDILVANGRGGYDSQAWHNNGDGTFSDVSVASGVQTILAGLDTYSVAAADYDADGDIDVHITAMPTDRLLQNQGDGTFIDVTAAAGLGGPPSTAPGNGSSKIGAWGDLDNDGWLDLVVASSTFDSHPPHAYLMRNDGDGTFTDVTAAGDVAISQSGNPCAVIWTDYDNDGFQDVLVFNDRGDSSTNRTLLRNDGDSTFTDYTSNALLDLMAAGNPMGIDGADVNRDGWLDYYVGNIGPAIYAQSRGDGTFINNSIAAGNAGEYTWGLGFEDLDHDGWWDLFVAQEDDLPYLTFQNERVDPPHFVEAEWTHGVVGNGGHNVAVAFADFDHDNDVDVVSANTSGVRLNLFRNDTPHGTNRWLEVMVPQTPGNDSYGGVSGRVVVKTGDNVVWRDISGGSSRASQSATSTRFGLGQWTGAEWVAVVWPTGEQLVVLNVEGNQRLQMPAP